MFTKEQQKTMLHRAARSSNMDGHIVATPPATMAERAMTRFGGKPSTPRKKQLSLLRQRGRLFLLWPDRRADGNFHCAVDLRGKGH